MARNLAKKRRTFTGDKALSASCERFTIRLGDGVGMDLIAAGETGHFQMISVLATISISDFPTIFR